MEKCAFLCTRMLERHVGGSDKITKSEREFHANLMQYFHLLIRKSIIIIKIKLAVICLKSSENLEKFQEMNIYIYIYSRITGNGGMGLAAEKQEERQ